jgi:hypothetical protein
LILLIEETESYDFYLQTEVRFGFVWDVVGKGMNFGFVTILKTDLPPG